MSIETETNRIHQERMQELDLTAFKLLPSAKPPLFHGHTVRKTVSSYFWRKKLRPFILEQQGNKCTVCGWRPAEEADIKHLHLHEVERYDFDHKVCHLLSIQLICRKCHAFHHIIRTEMVSTEEQWADLMAHFIHVNGCSPHIIKKFDWITAKALQLEAHALKEKEKEIARLAKQPVRYTVHPAIPFSGEMENQIRRKGLLYQTE
ncbi:hypothetical protein [Domibacillus robiginosus]|uniref:hypothetical protein n=1 Tax=Domibacillus robiginosus TaxID=1071054 RepID=UPI00067E0808|nr:hypothetical protein [Domibacillus robiginosus]